MTIHCKRVALRVVLFACFGLLIEVFFTAGYALLLRGNWNMMGNTSPWMLIVYGWLGLLIVPISSRLQAWHIPLAGRACIYMVLIFIVEYIYGVLFQMVGLKIWDYSGYAWNLHGHITLVYTPFWLFLGLWLEYLHKKLDACSVVMVMGLTGEDVLAGEMPEPEEEETV